MSAGEHLSDGQFRVIDEEGERPVSMKGRHLIKVPIEKLQPGMWARPTWQRSMPFQKITGPSTLDPDHPSHYEGDYGGDEDDWTRQRYYVTVHPRSIGPHQPEGTDFHVIARKGRPSGSL